MVELRKHIKALYALGQIILLVFVMFMVSDMKTTISDQAAIIQQQETVIQEDVVTLHNLQQLITVSKLKDTDPWQVISGYATAYSPFDDKNGINSASRGTKSVRTSTGTAPGPGLIAVDPARIPYGSQMVIKYADGTTEAGIAADTGSALRKDPQMHVDVFKYTYDEAINHGRQPVRIYWR